MPHKDPAKAKQKKKELYERKKVERLAQIKEYRENNFEKVAIGFIKRTYNVDNNTAESLYKDSLETCNACGFKWNSEIKRLCVDHDHKSGAVRGILCSDCNLALGKLKDSPLRIKQLLDYITNYDNK